MAWLVLLLAMVASASAQTLVPVPAPLTGSVTTSIWEKNDSNYPGITLACGKPFHYILAKPANYQPTIYKYPANIWLHPDGSGNSNYIGAGGDLFKMASGEAGSFNTTAFQTRHPSFTIAPSADQTNGNGTTGSCTGPFNSAVRNWGGWNNNGTVGSGTNYSGDNGPNTYAVVAMVKDLIARYPAIDPNRVYLNGFSLGGHGEQYLCSHYNAYTGDRGKIFAACTGSAGSNRGDGTVNATIATRMRTVPQWQYSGANDTTSPPSIWNSPLCSALGGNPGAMTGITSSTANRCGTSEMRYTLAPGVGHSDHEANGAQVWDNQIINDYIFSVSANTVTPPPPPPPPTGVFTVANGKLTDPAGAEFKARGANVYWNNATMSALCPTSACSKLLADFPGINFLRVVWQYGYTQSASGSSMEPYTTWLTNLGIVVDFTDFNIGPGQALASGSTLTNQVAWYRSLGLTYVNNPYVWVESQNEAYPGSGQTGATMSENHRQMYVAVRAVAPTKIVVMGFPGGGNPGTVGTGGSVNGAGMTPSVYAAMTGMIWDLHYYAWIVNRFAPGYSTDLNVIRNILTGSVSGAYGVSAARTFPSADGPSVIMIGEYGNSTTGLSNDPDGAQLVEATSTYGLGFAAYAIGTQAVGVSCCNTLTETNFNVTNPYGAQLARLILAAAGTQPPPGETLTMNAIAAVAQNTPFVVSGTIANATAAPSLQYNNNGGSWAALPAGAVVTATAYSFTNPGMTANPAATVSVRDANNNAVSATGPPFIVKAPESANNTLVVPAVGNPTPTFSDNFATLPLHRTWQAGDKWQLIAPDTPDGRGGPNFTEGGTQFWVNPFNPSTPISGIYAAGVGGLRLGLLSTPAPQAAYINGQAGATMPYVGALLNSSQTNYQKYGYWQFSNVIVPRIAGVSFQVDLENVQLTGIWPPEVDFRISTNASNVQQVLFQFALGGGQYTQYTTDSNAGFDASIAHTYGIDWQSTGLSFFIDNVQVATFPLPSTAYSTNPMFMFLLSASNYVGTGNPSAGNLPAISTIGSVDVYQTRGGVGPSPIITDSQGNQFQILANATIAINGGLIPTVSSNVIALAYVNGVVWQENTALNWYSYTGNGGWAGPTTTSPVTAQTETLAVATIASQSVGQTFVVSGSITGASVAPALEYQDNTGAWTALPAGATVSTSAYSFTHPSIAAGQYVVRVRDAAQTTISAVSNSFTVSAAPAEAVSVNTIGSQTANVGFTVSGTLQNVPGAVAGTNWAINPGQDGSYWKQPFQTSAQWITSGPLITALRSGTPSINTKGNFTTPWYAGKLTDPVVTVTDGTRSIQVHLPLGAIMETPNSAVDNSIGGSDATQPYLIWSISGATMNTASVQASGTIITGTYGFVIQDGAGLIMVDIVTGTPGTNNAIGNIQDIELAQILADPNYVIPHMLQFQLDGFQASTAGPIWPLKVLDTSPSPAFYTGPIPQGITIGIPASTPRPAGKTRAWYALFDQLQRFGMISYNFGATGGVNVGIYDSTGQYASLVTDLQTAWVDLGRNYVSILAYDGTPGSQFSLATTKGAVVGSTNAFPAPALLDLTPTGGQNVPPSAFGAWYPNTSYIDTPTNPGAPVGAPALEYQDGAGVWQALPAGAVVTGSTFTFTHPAMTATSSAVVSVRDAAHTTAFGASNVFVVSSSAAETLAIDPIATPQHAGAGFAVTGTIANISAAPTLQYQDNGGAWQALPAGSTITVTPGGSGQPSFADEFSTLSITPNGGAPSGTVTTLLVAPTANSFTTPDGAVWTISAGGAVLRNGVAAAFSANVAKLALISGTDVYHANTTPSWYKWNGTGWDAASDPTQGGVTGAWMDHYAFGGSEYTLSANNEAQYFGSNSAGRTPGFSPFSIVNGALRITADTVAHTVSNPLGLPYNSGAFTSATETNGLPTHGLWSGQYGYIAIKTTLPGGRGLWPGLVLYPEGGGVGEIDIVEALGDNKTRVYFTLHCSTCSGQWLVDVSDYTVNSHEYAVNWQADFMTFYVDGVVAKDVNGNPVKVATPADMKKPYYLAMDFAVGGVGSWPGPPDGSTVFPAHMDMDYIRVFSAPPGANTAVFSFSHPGVAATASLIVAVRDAAATAITATSNAVVVLLAESPNNAVVTTVGPVIVDALGEAFAINAAGQVTVNGVIDATTSSVVALAYVNHVVWQRNAAGLWFSKPNAAAPWSAGVTTSPLPPETLAINSIAAQVAGVPFTVSGAISNALLPPTLQYSVSSGPWVAFPVGSSVSASGYTLTVPGIATAGSATIGIRDAGTPTISTISGSFTVAAAPVEQLAFAQIPAQQTNVAFRVTGSIANAQTIPTLQYQVNGGAWNALPAGSPASLTTQTSFAFTVPGIAVAGSTTLGIRDAATPSISAQSNSFQIGTPVGETLAIGSILGQLAGQPFIVGGVIGNAVTIPTLQYAVNAGSFQALPVGAAVSLTSFSFPVPGQAAGATTITVRDAATPAVTATSNSFVISPVGNEALFVNPVQAQSVGTSFAISGTITNLTAAPVLQYADNGGPFQPLPAGSSVTATNFSFIHPGLGATQSMTVVVRDANHVTISSAPPPFKVIARESPNLTVVTTVGPQIVDADGNVWTLTPSGQVAENGTTQAVTTDVIEIAYVNRQIWYENSNLQWWVFTSTGTWSPTGGTALGPLPSSKANIYQTKTAKLAVVQNFTVAIPGIIVNDTVVGGQFSLVVSSTNGTGTMPGASGSGSASMTLVGTLAAVNQALAGLQYMGKVIGVGVVSITITDPAMSVATSKVNITVVRAAPVISPGRR